MSAKVIQLHEPEEDSFDRSPLTEKELFSYQYNPNNGERLTKEEWEMDLRESLQYRTPPESVSRVEITISLDYEKSQSGLQEQIVFGYLYAMLARFIHPRFREKYKYHPRRVEKPDGIWLAKSYREVASDTNLKFAQVKKAVKGLTEKGIFITRMYKYAGIPKVHFRLENNCAKSIAEDKQ